MEAGGEGFPTDSSRFFFAAALKRRRVYCLPPQTPLIRRLRTLSAEAKGVSYNYSHSKGVYNYTRTENACVTDLRVELLKLYQCFLP